MYDTAMFCKEGRGRHGVMRSGRSHVSGLFVWETFVVSLAPMDIRAFLTCQLAGLEGPSVKWLPGMPVRPVVAITSFFSLQTLTALGRRGCELASAPVRACSPVRFQLASFISLLACGWWARGSRREL